MLSSGLLQLPCATRFDGVRQVVVDLGGLEFCDLAGLRRLAHLYTDFSSTGVRVDLVAVPDSLRRLARLVRISHDSLPIGQ